MKTIRVGEALGFGWEAFKKRPWLFIGMVLVVALVSGVLSGLSPDPADTPFKVLLALAVVVLNVLLEMGLVAFALKAHDDVEKVKIMDLWHPQRFWQYFATKILMGVIVAGPVFLIVTAFLTMTVSAGMRALLLILLVAAAIWAVVASLSLIFSTYLVIDRGTSVIDALKKSVNMTKGHRWQLFFLALALLGINILGAIALLVGLFVSVPVSLLAVAHSYRKFVGKVSE